MTDLSSIKVRCDGKGLQRHSVRNNFKFVKGILTSRKLLNKFNGFAAINP